MSLEFSHCDWYSLTIFEMYTIVQPSSHPVLEYSIGCHLENHSSEYEMYLFMVLICIS